MHKSLILRKSGITRTTSLFYCLGKKPDPFVPGVLLYESEFTDV